MNIDFDIYKQRCYDHHFITYQHMYLISGLWILILYGYCNEYIYILLTIVQSWNIEGHELASFPRFTNEGQQTPISQPLFHYIANNIVLNCCFPFFHFECLKDANKCFIYPCKKHTKSDIFVLVQYRNDSIFTLLLVIRKLSHKSSSKFKNE